MFDFLLYMDNPLGNFYLLRSVSQLKEDTIPDFDFMNWRCRDHPHLHMALKIQWVQESRTKRQRFYISRACFQSNDLAESAVKLLLHEILIFNAIPDSLIREIVLHVRAMESDERNAHSRILPVGVKIKVYKIDERFGVVPAREDAIQRLETVRIDKDCCDCYDWMKQCMICCEEYRKLEKVTRLPCGHVFHGDCIVQRLLNSHMCPLCGFELPHSD